MNAPLRLMPLPAPPHDPTSWLLAGWIGPAPARGWQAAQLDAVRIDEASRQLVLAPAPEAARRLTELSGSFGGRVPPRNVVLTADGQVLLLDPTTGAVLRFDPCRCAFARLPCFMQTVTPPESGSCLDPGAAVQGTDAGRRRVPPTQLAEPHALALCGDELLIADSGHGRVLRFALHGPMPRGTLQLPAAARHGRAAWRPVALACDGHGRLAVADAAGACIDLFDAGRRWLRTLRLEAPAWALAFDSCGALLAVTAQAQDLVLDAAGAWQWRPLPVVPGQPAIEPRPQALRWTEPLSPQAAAEALAEDASGRLPPPRAQVDLGGGLALHCAGTESSPASVQHFDPRGRRQPPPARVAESYRRSGHYRSSALDAAIDGCTWHRVELRGHLPAGCRIVMRSYTAQVALRDDELPSPGPGWSAPVEAASFADGRWDALITSPPGRWLWLALEFTSDGRATPQLESVVVEYPRIPLRRYLPAVFGSDPAAADFTDRFTALYDTTLRSIEQQLDRLPALFDPRSAPAPVDERDTTPDFLGWLADWIGVTLARDWPLPLRRRLLAQAAALYPLRGTPDGLRRQLLLLLGFDRALAGCPDVRGRRRCAPLPLNCALPPPCTPAAPPALLLEHFKLRRWLIAGRGRLGDDSVLWGRRIVDRAQLSGVDLPPSGNARVGASRLIATPDPQRDPLLVAAHRISVFVPARVREAPIERRALQSLLAREVPAQVEVDLRWVEPRMRVGIQAMVGLDSVVARTPAGVRLDEARLRQGTVLTGAGGRRAPLATVGRLTVGSTTLPA